MQRASACTERRWRRYRWLSENGAICRFGFFGRSRFFEANPCDEASFGLVANSLFYRYFGSFGVLEPEFPFSPFEPPRWLSFCTQKNITFERSSVQSRRGTIKIRGNFAKRTNRFIFTHVQGGSIVLVCQAQNCQRYFWKQLLELAQILIGSCLARAFANPGAEIREFLAWIGRFLSKIGLLQTITDHTKRDPTKTPARAPARVSMKVPTEAPTKVPRNIFTFPVFTPSRTLQERSYEMSHKGVHGSAHGSAISRFLISHVLFCGHRSWLKSMHALASYRVTDNAENMDTRAYTKDSITLSLSISLSLSLSLSRSQSRNSPARLANCGAFVDVHNPLLRALLSNFSGQNGITYTFGGLHDPW